MDHSTDHLAYFDDLVAKLKTRIKLEFDERATLNSFWTRFKNSGPTTIDAPCNFPEDCSYEKALKNKNSISFYDTKGNVIFPALEKLYIRDHYADLFEEMQKYKGCTITGSPGIGKSVFILFALKEFYMASKRKGDEFFLILIKGNKKEKEFFLFTDLLCKPVDNIFFKQHRSNSKYIFLIDQQYKDICDTILGKVFLFASPNKENYNKFEKIHQDILYMPTWSMKELHNLNRIVHSLPIEEIEERFFVFGGKPRLIFGQSIEIFKREILSYITIHTREKQGVRYLMDLAKQVAVGQGKMLDLPFNLTSLNCASEDFKGLQIDIASVWIQKVFLNELKDLSKSDLKDFLSFSKR